MKKIFMLVGMMILLIAITSISGCTSPRYSFTEGVFKYQYNPCYLDGQTELLHLGKDLYIDEVQIEIKNITKEEYDVSNFKNVIKNLDEEEYHSIIIKFKYSKESELTQYDMYDMSSKVTLTGNPDQYPIKICLNNDQYNIEGYVQSIITIFEDYISLSFDNAATDYIEKNFTIDGEVPIIAKNQYFEWHLQSVEKISYNLLMFNNTNYKYYYNDGYPIHKLTEDLVIDEVHMSFSDITNEEYLENNFINVIDTNPNDENSAKKKIEFLLKFECEEEPKKYDVIFLPQEKHIYSNIYTLVVKLINKDLELNIDLKFNLGTRKALIPTAKVNGVYEYIRYRCINLTFISPSREYSINGVSYTDYEYSLSIDLLRIQ